MQPKKNKKDPHIDWSRFGKKPQKEINADAKAEKARLGLSGRYKRFVVHINGVSYEIPIPKVRAIRERLSLTQAEFARKFHLSQRTVQQWEQRRAMPDMPAQILLKAIERAPEVIEKAAAEVQREIKRLSQGRGR